MERNENLDEFKRQVLKVLDPEGRVMLFGDGNNNSREVIPDSIRREIDKIYNEIEELSRKYSISTEGLINKIQDSKLKINQIVSRIYQDKTHGQLDDMRKVISNIERKINDDNGLNTNREEQGIEETFDNKDNNKMALRISEELSSEVKNLYREMQKIIEKQGWDSEKLNEFEFVIYRMIRGARLELFQEAINTELRIDDEKVKEYIMERFKEFIEEISKFNEPDRKKYVEGLRVGEDILPKQTQEAETGEEQKGKKTRAELELPDPNQMFL